MQISKKKNGKNILILFFKLEILTLKQGSGFFGKRQELLSTENTTWGLGKGMLEPLIVFLGIKLWLSLGLLLPQLVWEEIEANVDWNPGWHLGFSNNICFKKSGAIPGHGAGKQVVLEGLEFLSGTEIRAWRPGISWISCSSLECIPWKLEQSLALMAE